MKHKLTIIALVLGFLYSNCNKNDTEPLYSNGMITGIITMQDDTEATNAVVTAYGPYGNSSTLADASGKYELTGIGNGTYEVEFTKEGYGKIIHQGVQVFGNDTIWLNERLQKMADYTMPTLYGIRYYSEFSYMEQFSVAITTDISVDNDEQMQIRVFVGDTEDVSPTNYLHSDQASAVKHENQTLMVVDANPQIVNGEGERLYPGGKKLYLIAYVCSIEDYGTFNEYYGLPVFSTVDEQQHSQVLDYTAP